MKKIVKVKAVGDIAYIDGVKDSCYTIEELNIKSDGNLFYLKNYYYNENGKSYNVIDAKGNIISTIKLSEKKDELLRKKIYVNLTEYDFKVLYIPFDVDEVYIKGEEGQIKELSINIEYRSVPLDIHFNNVNIYTKERVPVIYNYSESDINIYVEGNNSLKAGNQYPLVTDLEMLKDEEITEDLEMLLMYPFVLNAVAKKNTISILSSAPTLNSQYVEEFNKNLEDEYKLTKIWWDSLYNILTGDDGIDGFDGVPAIHSISGVSFRGGGCINIFGGNGTNGTDASKVAVTGAKGGNGGDSGPALYVHTYINIIGENCKLYSGEVGTGGQGTKFLGHKDGEDGKDGSISNEIKAIYIYEKD